MNKNSVDWQSRSLYGLNLEQREQLLESQNNSCAICGTQNCKWGKGFNNTWHIDHKHDGTVNHRSILCARCNLILGKLGDNINFIQKFIDYLNKYEVTS